MKQVKYEKVARLSEKEINERIAKGVHAFIDSTKNEGFTPDAILANFMVATLVSSEIKTALLDGVVFDLEKVETEIETPNWKPFTNETDDLFN